MENFMKMKDKEIDLEQVKEKAQKAREVATKICQNFCKIAKDFSAQQKSLHQTLFLDLKKAYEETLDTLEVEWKDAKKKPAKEPKSAAPQAPAKRAPKKAAKK